jgi:hypothetical protein
VIAGGQTIATHCLACGPCGELDPRVLAVAEGEATTMGARAAQMGHVTSSSGRISQAASAGTSCLPQRVHKTKVSGSVGTR